MSICSVQSVRCLTCIIPKIQNHIPKGRNYYLHFIDEALLSLNKQFAPSHKSRKLQVLVWTPNLSDNLFLFQYFIFKITAIEMRCFLFYSKPQLIPYCPLA